MSIREIYFKNYENHIDTRLILPDSGIVSITGETDSGKSALLRGLKALVEKDSFCVNDDSETGTVGVVLLDGTDISRTVVEELSRKKCPACNFKLEKISNACPECNHPLQRKVVDDYYSLNGMRTKDSGSVVPMEVARLLNMDRFAITEKQTIGLNMFLKGKVDSLVDLSPSDRVGLIGSVGSDILSIDQQIKNVVKDERNITDDIKTKKQNITIIQDNIRKLDGLDDLLNPIKDFNDLNLQIANAQLLLREMNSLEKGIVDLGNTINAYQEDGLKIAEQSSESLSNLEFDISMATGLVQSISSLDRQVSGYSKIENHSIFEGDAPHEETLLYNSMVSKFPSEKVDSLFEDADWFSEDFEDFDKKCENLKISSDLFYSIGNEIHDIIEIDPYQFDIGSEYPELYKSLSSIEKEIISFSSLMEDCQFELDSIQERLDLVDVCPCCNKPMKGTRHDS